MPAYVPLSAIDGRLYRLGLVIAVEPDACFSRRKRSPLAVGEHWAATISRHEKEERRAATPRSVQQGGLECPPTFKGLASLSQSRRDPLTANREHGDTCPRRLLNIGRAGG